MPPAVAARVVVVTWNGAHLLPACLDSLEAQTVRDSLDVVVVDNASQDGTAELLADRYPGVRVVRAPRNLGFAGGAALGMRGCTTEHVVLLNNDATFAPDAVEVLLAAFDGPGNERVGAATARILLTGDEPVLVNSTGNVLTAQGAGTDRDYRRPLGTESTDPDVFGFCGGAAALRREMLDDVGGFDPTLFLYYEDTDLSWRMRAAGWSVRYVPEAQAVHEHAASSGTDSPVFRYYNTRNSLLVLTRHAPAALVIRSFGRQSAGLVRAAVRRGPAGTTGARARGLAHYVGRLPRTLGERRRLWRDASVPRSTVAQYVGRGAA
ncbi:glycosyltransferase family 2 protein [Cellulomonas humilata]|uniref:Glycosyltransferase family 2 protein n=1 Tax=Cellulomonas humilata TaxID=144055 RepID=A0A7Y6A0A9_9CELL|nr:glycosyltransferase family 2 protein [Cellulomonas humilata]